jgi:polyisoprenoid-binding protein YceI
MSVAAGGGGQGTRRFAMAQVAREIEGMEGIAMPPAGTYELDIAHTTVEFVARHMLSKVRGRFTDFSGAIEVAEKPEDSSVKVEIQTASIKTDTEKRDEHLKSGDFLLIEEYPKITFASTAVRPTGGTSFELEGDLTIKGVTKPVTLTGEFLGTGPGMDGETPLLAASAKVTIEREDWGVNWNMAVETGGFLVSKKVDLEIEVEAHKVA